MPKRRKAMSSPNGRHTAIYLRVSSAEQLERYGYEAQRTALTALCKRENWVPSEEYEERAASAGPLQKRPVLRRLLERIRTREVERLVVFDIDRLSREEDPREWAEIAGTCLDAECPIVTPSATYDLAGDSSATLMGFIKQWGAAEERKAIVRRGVGGRRESAKQGRWHAMKVPLGYTLNPETKGLDVDPAGAAIVEAMYRRYLEGQGFYQIRDWLSATGIAGRKWGHTSVAFILGNRTYTGEAEWGGATVPVPPIISTELFEKVQQERKRRRAHAWRAKPKHAFLLRGLVRCSECGGAMVPQVMGKARYYRCLRYMRERSCKARAVRAEKLHAKAWAVLEELAFYHDAHHRDPDAPPEPPWMFDRCLQGHLVFAVGLPEQRVEREPHGGPDESGEPDPTISIVLQRQLDDAEASIDRVWQAIGTGTGPEEEAAHTLEGLRKERDLAKAALAEAQAAEEEFRQVRLAENALHEAFAGVRAVLEAEEQKSEEEQASFVREHIFWLSLLPSGEMEVCFKVMVEGGSIKVTGLALPDPIGADDGFSSLSVTPSSRRTRNGSTR